MPRHTRALSAVLALTALLTLATTPTLAKMEAEARLDAAIPRDAEPGSTIKVGWSVFSVYDGSELPLYGSPVFIRLISPDRRSVSEVMGSESPGGSGHYTASIVVPTGGIGEVIVGLLGESCDGNGCQRSDIIFPLTDDPLVDGAAPPPVASQLPVASRVPMASVGTTQVEPARVAPAQSPTIAAEVTPAVAIVVALAVAGGLAALLVGRRRTLGTDAAGR